MPHSTQKKGSAARNWGINGVVSHIEDVRNRSVVGERDVGSAAVGQVIEQCQGVVLNAQVEEPLSGVLVDVVRSATRAWRRCTARNDCRGGDGL